MKNILTNKTILYAIIILEIVVIILRVQYPCTEYTGVLFGVIASTLPGVIYSQFYIPEKMTRTEFLYHKLRNSSIVVGISIVTFVILNLIHVSLIWKFYFSVTFMGCSIIWLIIYTALFLKK